MLNEANEAPAVQHCRAADSAVVHATPRSRIQVRIQPEPANRGKEIPHWWQRATLKGRRILPSAWEVACDASPAPAPPSVRGEKGSGEEEGGI